jgi:hypothetical protein
MCLFFSIYPAQASNGVPAQDASDVAPLSIYFNGIYVLGDLWQY